MSAAGSQQRALSFLGSQICFSKSLASMQKLAVESSKAAGCFHATAGRVVQSRG